MIEAPAGKGKGKVGKVSSCPSLTCTTHHPTPPNPRWPTLDPPTLSCTRCRPLLKPLELLEVIPGSHRRCLIFRVQMRVPPRLLQRSPVSTQAASVKMTRPTLQTMRPYPSPTRELSPHFEHNSVMTDLMTFQSPQQDCRWPTSRERHLPASEAADVQPEQTPGTCVIRTVMAPNIVDEY